MGLLNDMAMRDISGNERKEDALNMDLYQEILIDKGPVKTGEYRKVRYEIYTAGAFPYVVMIFNPNASVRWPRRMYIKDVDGNRRHCKLSTEFDVSKGAYNHLVKIWYMDDTDFILDRQMNADGKIHTVKNIIADVRVFVDQILDGKFERK